MPHEICCCYFFKCRKSLWIFINNACPIPCAILYKMQANVDNKRQLSGTGLDRCEKVFTVFQRVQVQLGGRSTDRFYFDSCLISHIVLSFIHCIHWKAILFNITQRGTEPLAWLHTATVLMFAEIPKLKEINNSQFPWKNMRERLWRVDKEECCCPYLLLRDATLSYFSNKLWNPQKSKLGFLFLATAIFNSY